MPIPIFFIVFLKGHPKAIDFIAQFECSLATSTITVAKLYSSIKGEDEDALLEKLLEHFHIIPVTSSIAKKGGHFKNRYAKSHGIGIADALIAATAVEENASLFTLNIKHFPIIREKFAPY